jgi:hypothetical protein
MKRPSTFFVALGEYLGIRLSPSATKNVDGLFIENKEILESDPFASCIYKNWKLNT